MKIIKINTNLEKAIDHSSCFDTLYYGGFAGKTFKVSLKTLQNIEEICRQEYGSGNIKCFDRENETIFVNGIYFEKSNTEDRINTYRFDNCIIIIDWFADKDYGYEVLENK